MKPAHEVMDPSPELERVILNFGPLDYLTIGAFTFFNAAGGYAYGGVLKRPTAGTMAILGGLAGFLHCYTQTSFKLMGIKPGGGWF
ncbi:hypothetical protein SO694_00029261 [Aureococcus anophagefferens]|uniref:NADH-ubiquinone oxidoreductase 21kDa subunit N-terminal domain-containing protein n=1 Tax=Aureococcus anophagefferens TaxID=44056 RepID=A0ABR1FW08_AURAN|mmetsp:Transcript_26889/g.91561  ORF Transcript_26889/g.91561 Transcript_26889/m.91561 type:complete len:86 (-) Transcript_26889:60-317(-)